MSIESLSKEFSEITKDKDYVIHSFFNSKIDLKVKVAKDIFKLTLRDRISLKSMEVYMKPNYNKNGFVTVFKNIEFNPSVLDGNDINVLVDVIKAFNVSEVSLEMFKEMFIKNLSELIKGM